VIIATYNVNSIRSRLDRVLAWLDKVSPDVLCLQELKVPDESFPFQALEAVGYSAAVHGQRTYNGVAIISREDVTDVVVGMADDVDDPQARLITGSTSGITIVSAYVPNGQTVGSDKWAYKLAWYDRLVAFLERLHDPSDDLVLCGDFNVAPDDRDVARPEQWEGSVLCHADGRSAYHRLIEWGLEDTVRLKTDGPGPYSWWDYRRLAFPKGDGLRIDHVLATRSMAARLVEAYVDRDERKGSKPSDHAPVVAVFE
jgi:exodeoxyribonuclease-3